MDALIASIDAELAALGHEDALDTASTHSRSDAGALLELRFGALLGPRRLWNLRGVHQERLEVLRDKLQPLADDPAIASRRGRVRRLLGDLAGAGRDFSRAADARSAGWEGELLSGSEPEKALRLLEKTAPELPDWPAPWLWRATALLGLRRWQEVFAALDAFEATQARAGSARTPLVHLLRSQAALDCGQPRRALDEAGRAISLEPASCPGHLMAAHAHVALGDVEAANASYNEARLYEPEMAGFHSILLRGRLKATWAQPEGYLEELDGLIRQYPRLAAFYAERAEVKRDPRLCRYAEALEDYAQAARLEPGAAWILAVLARAQDYSGGPAAALATFDRAIALAPRSGWMRAWRGEARRRAGDIPAAREDLDRAVELMPWYSFARAWRGALLQSMGESSVAARELDCAIRLDPGYVFAYYERFLARRALKRYAAAVQDLNHAYAADPKYSWLGKTRRAQAAVSDAAALEALEEALEERPGDACLLAWRGYSWLQSGDLARALTDLRAAASADPSDARVLSWLGWACRDAGRAEEAVVALRKAVARSPEDWFAWSLLADVYLAREELGEALEALSKVAALAPTTASAHFRKASLERALGKGGDALRDVRKAIELDRRYADAYILLTQILVSGGELDAASEAAAKAVEFAPETAASYLARAQVREFHGDFAGQAADFKKALELAPDLFSDEQRRQVEEMLGRIRA